MFLGFIVFLRGDGWVIFLFGGLGLGVGVLVFIVF